MALDIEYSTFFKSDLPAPSQRWNGFPEYNFIGGHNDSESIPIKSLKESIEKIILREGKTLSKYGLESGPQGYLPLRKFISKQLNHSAQIISRENEILVVSGSLQALDLVNETFLRKGDTVIIEEENYGGTISRLRRLGVNMVGIPLEHDGMNVEVLEQNLLDLRKKKITPRYIYTIPTIQNPTGTVMSAKKREILIDLSKQFEIPIFEDSISKIIHIGAGEFQVLIFGLIMLIFIIFQPLGLYGMWLKMRIYWKLFPFNPRKRFN